MRALIITAIVVVLILAVGIPVIHYATQSDTQAVDARTVSAKTLVQGRAAQNTPTEIQQTPPAAAPAEPEASAKEMLEQYRQGESNNVPTDTGSKTGYTIEYLIAQSKQEQKATCEPLLNAAQKKVDDAEVDVKAKQKVYDNKRDDLNDLMDSDADSGDIDDARDEMEQAKKAYEDALAAKYTAQDELVDARVKCASYLT